MPAAIAPASVTDPRTSPDLQKRVRIVFLRHGQLHSGFDPECRGSVDRASVAGKARNSRWRSFRCSSGSSNSLRVCCGSASNADCRSFRAEASRWRRRVLTAFLVAGLAVGLYLLFFIIRLPVTATVWENSIRYGSPHFYIATVLVVYLLATCASPLSSGHRWVNIFGALALVFAGVAAVVSLKIFVSVWCFYAAILSLILWLHFSGPMPAYRSRLAAPRRVGG